jgi:adenine deaminase
MLADDIAKRIDNERVLGLGEMMNYPGVLAADPMVLDKIAVAHKAGKLIDGHAPSLEGIGLDAYAAMGIRDDHECTTVEEARERLRRGMYVLVRQGTVCQDELRLLPAVTMANFRHCLFCTDDRQVASLLEEGSINNNVRLAVAHGFDPLMAISMATINSAECFRLSDRGAIDPGLRADFSLVDNLKDFKIHRVYVEGRLVAEGEQMLEPATPGEVGDKVLCNINIGSFSKGKLVLPLSQGHVRTIRLKEGGVVTEAGEASVKVVDGHFVHDPTLDVVKVCVLERHHGTGNIGLALLEGYGIKRGAVATTVAHDSHNIICCGCNDDDMYLAIETLKENHGGMVAVEGGKVLGKLSHPIAGLMSNRKASEVAESLKELGNLAWERLGVSKQYDPFMTLCFMALPVIPVYKVTDLGLFDVSKFSLVDIEIKD